MGSIQNRYMFMFERHGKQFRNKNRSLTGFLTGIFLLALWAEKGFVSTQFYTYKDNTKRENDFLSTQSFPVTLPPDLISAKCCRAAVFTKSIHYF